MRDTIALHCEPLRRASSGASVLKRRSGLPKRSTRQSKSERSVVSERKVCSQERDKGRVDAARQRQQTLFEERAHTAALNRRLAPGRGRDGEAQLTPFGLRDARQRGRRGPLQKLRDAPRAVEAAGFPSALSSSRVSSRLQTPTVLSQRSVVKRATSGSALVLTRSRLTSIQSLTFAAQLVESTSGRSQSSTANPSFSSTVACASA